ncbi:LytR C-terminal domain-containing protein [Fibrobacter sp. UWEL]|uniref:LytR C-terminal domain-containing protein n=1 Tax=Fibrobacter sp. UWEL TaxID=1896209 RepID=UPI000913308A|nr:LytR C-terminal domain-containing protein [Fibrobacter sp. UWEL]SHK61634.1 LytR cell envelope-related transcriptional attenuator [Fibrobacter sp. UWEL]
MRLIACLVFCALLLGCEEVREEAPKPQIVRTYKGDVELLNSCGIQGAASTMRTFLRENGFDVVSSRNDVLQNYEETIIVLRNPEWEGAQALAKTLKTKNVLVVLSDHAVVDAAVYIGKDFKQIIEPEEGK